MKANQKFLHKEDDAVSPVIAVILMVAITVVLAATVYVWVSGFGSSTSSAARSISLTKSQSGSVISYTVASSSVGLKWSDLKLKVSGASANYEILVADGLTNGDSSGAPSQTAALTPAGATTVTAGQQMFIINNGATSQTLGLTILDSNANSVMSSISGGTATADAAFSSGSLTFTRVTGTAGSWVAGNVLRITFPQAFQVNTPTAATFTLAAGSSPTFGASPTYTISSPTTIDITLGTAPSLGSSPTIASTATVKDVQGNAMVTTAAILSPSL